MADFASSSSGGLDGKTLVLQAVDLVALIGQTVALKKRGNSYIGLCPFHSEKSPSFNVHPDKGFFHCFGCKKSGNAIDFVIERDRLEFKDALRQLADQYHVELPRSGNREGAGLRQTLLDACAAAATYFEQNLQDAKRGEAGRAYLAKRGFNAETIKAFRLGMAFDGWDGLATSPLMKRFKPDILAQAGLLKPGEKRPGFYDTFRHRLMFPIRDESGKVIAFGGRVMPGNDSPAKYLNSPETPLFSKSKVAYGLDLGRTKIVETKTVAVVEGYTDVVMAHQFGAGNVISVLGTALTESHVNLLRRFAGRIVLLFDGDSAGEMAVQRALELFLSQPIEIAIATLPDGVDPDEYLLQNGTEAFDALLAKAEDALAFQWRQMSKKFRASGDDLTGQSQTVEEFLRQIAAARGNGPVDPIRWGGIVVRLSHLTRLPVDDLNRRFRKAPAGPEYSMPAPPPQFGQSRAFGSQGFQKRPFGQKAFGQKPFGPAPFTPRGPNDRPPPPRSFEQPAVAQNPPAAKKTFADDGSVPSDRRLAERWILGGLLNAPASWQRVQQVVSDQDFISPDLRPLAEWYWDHQRNEGEPELAEVIGLLDNGPLKTLVIELASEADTMNNPQTLTDGVVFIRQAKQQQADTELREQLRRSKDDPLSDDFEVDVLRKMQDAAGKRSA